MFKQVVPRLNFDHGMYAGQIGLAESNSRLSTPQRHVSLVNVSQAYQMPGQIKIGNRERKPVTMSRNDSYTDYPTNQKRSLSTIRKHTIEDKPGNHMIKNYRKHLSHLTKVKSQERADRDEQEINDDKKKKRIKQKLLNYNT